MAQQTSTQMLDVANALVKGTQSGKIEWQATTTQDQFEVGFPQYTIKLRGQPPLSMHLWIEKDVRGVRWTIAVYDAIQGDVGYKVLGELSELVRQQTLQVDEFLDKVLQDIGAISSV